MDHDWLRAIDATPTPDYPIRILKAYLSNGMRWCTSDGSSNELVDGMNATQDKRDALLEHAIKTLEEESGE